MASKKVKKFKLPKNYSAVVRALQYSPNQRDHITSFEHIRKFHNALLFRASEKGIPLPIT